MSRTHTPHDKLTPGFWYLRTDYAPFYTVVSLTPITLGPDEGKLGVWRMDAEGYNLLLDYDEDQFIGPVPAPDAEVNDAVRSELIGLKAAIDASAWHYIPGGRAKRILVAETAVDRITNTLHPVATEE